MTEQNGRARDIGASPAVPEGRNAARAGGTPVRDLKTPAAMETLEKYRQNLDRLSNELDEYFSLRRLMPRE